MLIFRFFRIIAVSLIFRLDEYYLSHPKALWFRYVLSLVLFWRSKEGARGYRIRRALETLGPIFVKFGQVLSTRRDLIPLDIADELAFLQDKVLPAKTEEIKDILTSSYEVPLEKIFASFDWNPIASASVAQVHFGRLIDGTEVAVKILRPNISKVIDRDISLLRLVGWLFEVLSKDGKRLKPLEIIDEFEKHLHDELDLMREAANASQLRRNFPDSEVLKVPEIYWDYCSSKVMVMEKMEGTSISQISTLKAQGVDLSKLASTGVEIFFTQVFRDGFFHADMHPGNILVTSEGNYVALDFGIMGTLDSDDRQYLARNFVAFFRRDYREVAQAHLDAHWVPSDTRIDEFETAIRAVCEPIFDRPLKDISFGKLLFQLFRMARRFNVIIQPQLIMLQKTLLNIEGLGRELDPNLDLWATAKPFLEKWLSQQLGWKGFLSNLRQEFPQWNSMLPQLPRLVYRALDETQSGNHEKLIAEILNLKRGYRRISIALLALSVGVIAIGLFFLVF